jgi:hypothetical protein
LAGLDVEVHRNPDGDAYRGVRKIGREDSAHPIVALFERVGIGSGFALARRAA